MLLDLAVKLSVSMRIEQIQDLLLGHDLAFLVENLEVVLVKKIVNLVNLLVI